MLLSKILSKEILSIYDGSKIATISGAVFNQKMNKIKGFSYFDLAENEGFLPIKDIFAYSDVVSIKNHSKLVPLESAPIKILGVPAFDYKGRDLSKIADVEIDIFGNVLFYHAGGNKFSQNALLKLGEVAVFCEDEKRKLSYFKNRNVFASTLQLPTIKMQSASTIAPIKLTANITELAGKKLGKDLLGKNSELLARAGSVVSHRLIDVCRQQNLLSALFFACE